MHTLVRGGLVVLATLAVAGTARAHGYPGWGDTGWVYASKRDCCAAAIAIAGDYSMQACLDAGGMPRTNFGSQRGTCKAEWMQGGEGGMLYRCYGETTVWCR